MKNEKAPLSPSPKTPRHIDVSIDFYLSLLDRFARIPEAAFSVIGEIRSADAGTLPLAHVEIVRGSNITAKRVLVTAGFHGDEPAGVLALLRFLEEHAEEFPQISIHAFPCLNPIGFVRKQRLGSTHHDLNRVIDQNSIAPEVRFLMEKLAAENLHYDAVLDLHEDNPEVPCDFAPEEGTPDGFYLYESVRGRHASLSGAVIGEVRRKGFPISSLNTIYGDSVENGVITSSKRKADLYDFERFTIENITQSVVTAETPMNWNLEDRVEAQVSVLRGALGALAIR